jgi:carboxypeptidase PM20D1
MAQWRRVILGALLAAVLLLGVVAGRTALLPSGIEGAAIQPTIAARLQAMDEQAIASRIGEAVRFPTVITDGGPADSSAFVRLHDWLEATYPGAHEVTKREVVSDLSLVYRWPGLGRCPAIGFVSHLDVVPVEDDTREDWTHPPFDGVVADGFVWGRGAIDTKDNLVYIMEAVERLASRGFEPACDVYLLFGHDEETGGESGAGVIARALTARGVRFAWLLDEGAGLGADWSGRTVPPEARVSVSHQGHATLRLTARAEGGHTASGVESTAVSRLAAAVAALEDAPMSGGLEGVAREGLVRQAAGGPLHHRVMAANLWLFRPLAERILAARPGTRGKLRTTMAPTVIEGGFKVNALPQRATALVSARLHFRDAPEDALAHVRRVAAPFDVEVELVDPTFEARPPTSADHPAFLELEAVLRQVHGPMRVVPEFMTGGTDARHYAGIADAMLNYDGTMWGPEASRGLHGTDERLLTKYLPQAVLLHELLIERHGFGHESQPD